VKKINLSLFIRKKPADSCVSMLTIDRADFRSAYGIVYEDVWGGIQVAVKRIPTDRQKWHQLLAETK
jgi:hypothetical protein